MVLAFPEFNLFVIYSEMQFCFVTIFPKYVQCHIFVGFISNQYIMILAYITIHLVSFVLTSRPTCLLASNKTYVIFFVICDTYVFVQYINIVSTDQELMCSLHVFGPS